MEEAKADVEDDKEGELQNLPPGESDRITGPLDLVFEEEDEVTIGDQRREREEEERESEEEGCRVPSLGGPSGR